MEIAESGEEGVRVFAARRDDIRAVLLDLTMPGLSGEETYTIEGISGGVTVGKRLIVHATAPDGAIKEFSVHVRIDTPDEVEYYRHDGILPYVLRQLHAQAV